MNKFAVEFIGTFFLVLAVGFASGDLGPVAVGTTLMAMVYAGGHVSFAHYNPAVTIAFLIRGRLPKGDLVPYIVSQLIAASAAAGIVIFFKGGTGKPGDFEIAHILVAELLFTFALVWIILNVATAKGTEKNQFYGIAIGTVVMGGAFAVGSLSGAAFNPAVVLGSCIFGGLEWSQVWAYLLSTFAGAAIAAYVFLAFVEGGDES